MQLYNDPKKVYIYGDIEVKDSLTATPSQTKISSQETLINSSITTTGGQLDVGGTVSSKGLTINSTDGTLAKLFTSADAGTIYFGKSTADGEGAYIDYSKLINQVTFGIRGSGGRIWFNPSMTKMYGNLDVAGNITCSTLKNVQTINFVNSTKDDGASIKLGGTNDDETFLEISTSDNGNEPIYVRQYKRNYTTGVSELQREAALLDANGNTSFPGALTVAGKEVATKEYVDSKVAEGGGGNLENVYTKAEVDERTTISIPQDIVHEGRATVMSGSADATITYSFTDSVSGKDIHLNIELTDNTVLSFYVTPDASTGLCTMTGLVDDSNITSITYEELRLNEI